MKSGTTIVLQKFSENDLLKENWVKMSLVLVTIEP